MRKINSRAVFAALMFVMVALIGPAARADGMLVPGPWPPKKPIDRIEPMFGIKYHHVNVRIDDQAARTDVDQVFENNSHRDMEATYLFPIPEKASITDFQMDVDGRMTEGRVLDRDEARKIYEQIVRYRKDPGLLEYVGRNLFKARVYPVPARGEKRIKLSYNELTAAQDETYRYVYPLGTERFSTRKLDSVVVTVNINTSFPLKNIYSPSHRIDVRRTGRNSAEVSYEESRTLPDRDFELFYSVSRDDVGMTLLTHKTYGRDGYFMLLASPDADSGSDVSVEKDVIFVFDRTGSMSGEKIEQARNALKFCINSLKPRDRFNVIPFNKAPDPLFETLETASRDNVARALKLAGNLSATGGTNIDEALRTAFEIANHSTRPGRPLYVLFLTDGLPTVGETDMKDIIENARDRATRGLRLFVFGVGYDVNTHLLDRLSEDHDGASEYVSPNEDIEVKVSDLYRMIAEPMLTDVKIDFGAMEAYDIVPLRYADIFGGRQLVVTGRYRNEGETKVRLSGYSGEKRREFVLRRNTRGGRHDFIPGLWAARQIGVLLDEIRLHGENRELVDEIVRLSKEFGIITEYTSFLVEEPETVFAGAAFQEQISEKAEKKMKSARREKSGSWAVAQSKNINTMKEMKAAPEEKKMYLDKDENVVTVENVKNASGRTFFLKDGVWMDSAYSDGMRVIKVKPFSEAQFELLKRVPELNRYFSIADRVLVVVGDVAVEISEQGESNLSEGDFKAVESNRDSLL